MGVCVVNKNGIILLTLLWNFSETWPIRFIKELGKRVGLYCLLGPFQHLFKFTSFHCVQQWCLCESSRQALYSYLYVHREFRDGVGRYMCPCAHKLRNNTQLVHLLRKKIRNKDIYICASNIFQWDSELLRTRMIPYQFSHLRHSAWHLVKGWGQGLRDGDWLRVLHQGGNCLMDYHQQN